MLAKWRLHSIVKKPTPSFSMLYNVYTCNIDRAVYVCVYVCVCGGGGGGVASLIFFGEAGDWMRLGGSMWLRSEEGN